MSVPTRPFSRRRQSTGQTTAEWLVIAGVVVAILIGLATVFRVQVATAFTILGTKIMCGVSGGANCTPAGTQTTGAGAGTGTATTGRNATTGLVTTTGRGGGGATAGGAGTGAGSGGATGGGAGAGVGAGGAAGGATGGGAGSGPGAGVAAGGAGGPGGLPPGTPRVQTGLGGPLDTLINTSPEFNQLVTRLQQEGYTFVTGRPGGGSFCNKDTKTVTIDLNDVNGKDLGDLAGTIAHELGHAGYDAGYTPYTGLTRNQYVAANVERCLKDEGEAVIKSLEMRDSVRANGGTPPITIRGVKAADYDRIYQQYLADGDREKARLEIGRLVGAHERTSNTKQSYNDYYGNHFRDYYNQMHPGGRK